MGENLAISVNAVLPLIICMAAGYLFRRTKLVDEGFCRKCNTFCFKTFLPLMIFMNVYNSDLESAVQPGAFLFAAARRLPVSTTEQKSFTDRVFSSMRRSPTFSSSAVARGAALIP